MHQANFVVFVCITYVAILFAVAFAGDRRARKNPAGLLSSPLVYTLSISIYCSSWTFFGSVGSAAKNGLEFLTIYLGPTIVFAGWWLFLRKLVTVGRVHHTTSIADFISARFGKSPVLGALITILALVAITPYIALQLKALTASFQVITYPAGAVVAASRPLEPDFAVAFWLAAGLCLFSIVFGVRNIDVNERHHGVIAAIAVEALVKLVAFMAVGLWVFFVLSRTPDLMFRNAPASLMSPEEGFAARWVALCFLSGAAVICLPRQFQVTVVENSSEEQIRTASWMFPLYLLLINLFVIPIAMAGLNNLPPGSDPDLFVLTLPMTNGGETVGLLAFLGGFSSATSMVIVSSIALSTMISNHIVMPLALRFSLVPTGGGQSARNFILVARRMSIVFTIFLGFTYFWISRTSGALASIGLISFCGLIQPLPSLIAGLYWHRATHRGAIAGLAAGFLIWAYTLFLPSFKGAFLMSADVIANGPFGLNWLNPHALFGLDAFDPLVHALFWSMTVNTALLVIVSLLREPTPLTRFQATLFIDIFRRQTESELGVIRRTARVSELRQIADRILGPVESVSLFDKGDVEPAVIASDELITLVETRLAANVGAASARSLVSRVVTSETISVDELKRLAGEAEQIRAYSAELESKSRQIEATAAELAEANDRLREIDVQKDEFLSQVSHEVRTPMTSIRSFSEILLKNRDLDESRKLHFLGIIQSESFRLTRLLDGILDLNFLEPGTQTWEVTVFDPETAIDQAIETCEPLARAAGVRIKRGRRSRNARVLGSRDRLTQVFINLVSNAIKHNTSANPEVVVTGAAGRKGFYEARVTDNGPGIPLKDRELIFTKFFRGQKARQGGVGLGLPISRQIVERFGGDLSCTSAKTKGAEFVVRLPLRFD
ncbi:sodium:solute symporter [Mesorhizobium sp. Root554]|uniref:sensor histidine kinase n=1 Tax=unclassified Mesorhizobium TaxID=325217 RepID=UPI0007004210|nr:MULTISPECIES: sensor histidine kinase [unclassified Mesorhizobium]KQZ13385.1 sodium:solute symporter [Mesorhizobium sp. Root1471]KQZ35898.1 sodium:solute symporter [Mesorhizobium sp. Root554]